MDTGEGGRGCEGEGKASEGERARADEGARARAIVDMADNNGKQQKRASDDGAARRRSSKINQYLFFDVGVCALATKKFWFTRDSAVDRSGSPRMRTGSNTEKFAYGETHYA